MNRSDPTTTVLVERLAHHNRAVEVGIGRATGIAADLAQRGVSVTATDVHPRTVPDEITFVRDDICDPDIEVYRGADVIYARNLPRELHRPLRDVADCVDAAWCFTTLGFDRPAIQTESVRCGQGMLHCDSR